MSINVSTININQRNVKKIGNRIEVYDKDSKKDISHAYRNHILRNPKTHKMETFTVSFDNKPVNNSIQFTELFNILIREISIEANCAYYKIITHARRYPLQFITLISQLQIINSVTCKRNCLTIVYSINNNILSIWDFTILHTETTQRLNLLSILISGLNCDYILCPNSELINDINVLAKRNCPNTILLHKNDTLPVIGSLFTHMRFV